jgi:Zn2+/Cd2+-exporting ATPase
MEIQSTSSIDCADCRAGRPTFFARYRDFLLSRDTIIAIINAVLLLAGFFVSISGSPEIGNWLYLASAVIGGIPLFLLASKAVFIRHDITAGFMATVAMIAAILVGEYSAAALVVFMFAIGDWLENLTIARANNALKELARLVPPVVTVVRHNRECIIPVEQVVTGDIVLVRSGERIGVDGIVMSGTGSINQSAITGESIPVDKKNGDDVLAGTINEVGMLEIRVTRVGDETTLGQIVKLVKDAQQSKAPVQRVADKYARILVPITFSIAILVYLLTGDITRSITILVVVCPCALVLATPTAVAAAIGNAAKQGILVKSGAVIEQVGKIDVVAFDKTGTLTHGKPIVQQIIALDGYPANQILSFAASIERGSEHPIGRSIVQASIERKIEPVDIEGFAVLPGYGVTGMIGTRQVVIGNRALLGEQSIAWAEEVDQQVQQFERQGQTVIPVAVDGKLRGLITLSDTPRMEAKQAVAELKRIGIREVIMITGDNPRTADRIAKELGIDRVYAEVLPQDKLRIIRELQAEGKKVAFVGDGVNDAPALAAAEIGIAMGLAGTDVALETADIGLMADEIERIPEIIDLSRTTLAVIKQNVIFSMSMNVVSVLLGGLAIIGPVAGALMHEASALPVLANSARMINYHRPVVK